MSGLLLLVIAQVSLSPALPAHQTASQLDNRHEQSESYLAPRARDDVEFAPAWVSEPSTRGTFRLLYSCLFTLTLCVYTAIHLNVPKRRETLLELIWRKLKWVLIAVFAPELVLYAAYVQWHVASVMCRDLNKMAKERNYQRNKLLDDEDVSPWVQVKRKVHKEKHKRFSLIYGYYVIMGGLVMDVRDLHDEYSRVTITPEGLLHLASKGHFIEVSDGAIKDKSKSDAFAKMIVILQVTWMIVQTCSRLVAGLPVTIIEGHTLVHVVSALAMYTLWFKKPLNISESTMVDHEAFVNITALMLIRCSKLGARASTPDLRPKRNKRSWGDLPLWKRMYIRTVRLLGMRNIASNLEDSAFNLGRLTLRPDDTSESAYLKNYLSLVPEVKATKNKTKLQRRGTELNAPESSRTRLLAPSPEVLQEVELQELPQIENQPETGRANKGNNQPVIILKDNSYIQPTSYFHGNELSTFEILIPNEDKRITTIESGQYLQCGLGPDTSFDTLIIELSPKTIHRWEAAGKALSRNPIGVEDAVCYFIIGQPSNLPLPEQEGLGWFGDGTIFGLVVVFFFLCTGYGGVHCIAWNSDFATELELTLWRVACIDLAVAGLAYFLLFTFYMGTKEGNHTGSLSSLSRGIILMFGWGHFVMYLVARVFLVVEAFISVRHLRAGAYEMVDWAAFIPHL